MKCVTVWFSHAHACTSESVHKYYILPKMETEKSFILNLSLIKLSQIYLKLAGQVLKARHLKGCRHLKLYRDVVENPGRC